MSDDVRTRLYECWHRGNGINETRACLRRACGQQLSFEDVHRTFVQLAAHAPSWNAGL